MVAGNKSPLRPMRLTGTERSSVNASGVLPVPEHRTTRAMASNRDGDAQHHRPAATRDSLQVALVAPDRATAMEWRTRARIIKPTSFKGDVRLHVITTTPDNADPAILIALIDLGLVNAKDTGIIGYPEPDNET